MAKIKRTEGLSTQEITEMVNQGAKFVIFEYTISILVMTFKRSSEIYFVRPNESTASMSIGFTLMTLVLGWWGIPWGPIYTIGSLLTNLSGGKNITPDIMSHLRAQQ